MRDSSVRHETARDKVERTWMKSRLESRQSVVLQHMKKSLSFSFRVEFKMRRKSTYRLSGIIKAKEEDFSVLV